MTKLNSNCDQTQNSNVINSKTQIVTLLKNLKFYKNQEILFFLQNLKTKIVTKLKNLNCNKTEKLELGQNSTQFDKIQPNSTTQIVTKLNN